MMPMDLNAAARKLALAAEGLPKTIDGLIGEGGADRRGRSEGSNTRGWPRLKKGGWVDGGPGTVRTRVMLPDKAWSGPPRPLPRLQTKLSLPSRWQRPRTTAWVCFRAVVRSVRSV
jgi:hypothetical protein